MIKAKDCKCCKCQKKAVAFFPVCDPDIPSYPYCRKCLDKTKSNLMMELLGVNEQMRKFRKELKL